MFDLFCSNGVLAVTAYANVFFIKLTKQENAIDLAGELNVSAFIYVIDR